MPRSRSTAIQIRAHPPPRAARLDLARQLDRPAEQQQFLGQCAFAGVWVRDDRNRLAVLGSLIEVVDTLARMASVIQSFCQRTVRVGYLTFIM
jgi:hypothetical protein